EPVQNLLVLTDDNGGAVSFEPGSKSFLAPFTIGNDQERHLILQRAAPLFDEEAADPMMVHAFVNARPQRQPDAAITKLPQPAHCQPHGTKLVIDRTVKLRTRERIANRDNGEFVPVQPDVSEGHRQGRHDQPADVAVIKNRAQAGGRHFRLAEPEFLQLVSMQVGARGGAIEKVTVDLEGFPTGTRGKAGDESNRQTLVHRTRRPPITHERGDQRIGAITEALGYLLNSLAGG